MLKAACVFALLATDLEVAVCIHWRRVASERNDKEINLRG